VLSAGEGWNNQSANGWAITYTLIENISLDDISIEVDGAELGADYYLNVFK